MGATKAMHPSTGWVARQATKEGTKSVFSLLREREIGIPPEQVRIKLQCLLELQLTFTRVLKLPKQSKSGIATCVLTSLKSSTGDVLKLIST